MRIPSVSNTIINNIHKQYAIPAAADTINNAKRHQRLVTSTSILRNTISDFMT